MSGGADSLFCLLALPARVCGLRLGYRYGDEATDLLMRVDIEKAARNIKRAVAVMIGASTVIMLYNKTGLSAFSTLHVWLSMILVAVFVLCFRLVSARAGALKYWYPLILAGFGLAAGVIFKY